MSKTKYNKKVHKKHRWRGGILVEKGPQGVEGHFQTAFTVDEDANYTAVEILANKIPSILEVIESEKEVTRSKSV